MRAVPHGKQAAISLVRTPRLHLSRCCYTIFSRRICLRVVFLRRSVERVDIFLRPPFKELTETIAEMYTTYILKCADTSLYTGSTNNLEKRVLQHNESKSGAHYTKIRRPVTLVYSEEFRTLHKARTREAVIKKMTRNMKLALINVSLLDPGSSPACLSGRQG